ncbi:MAG: hypothetical protein PHI11_07370 [Gallionella sp.]|nr:hypothetical protein [Gallionella sp.]
MDIRVVVTAATGFLLIYGCLQIHEFSTWSQYLLEIASNPLMLLGLGLICSPFMTALLFARAPTVPRRLPTEEVFGVLYTQKGGRQKVRYGFDEQNGCLFVAGDVCRIVGTPPPKKRATHLHRFPLSLLNGELCLSKSDLQTYLTSLSQRKPAANQLLIDIRKDLLQPTSVRKMDNATLE